MHTKHIIAGSLVLGICFVSIMALVTRLLVHKHAKHTTDEMHIADGNTEHKSQLAHISNSWKRMFTRKQEQSKGHWVPTLTAIIKAGDEGLVSSTLLAKLYGQPGEISSEKLYEVFAEELRSRPVTERSTYSRDLSKFLSSTKRVASGHKRVQSVSHGAMSRTRADSPVRALRMSLDLSAIEMGITRSISVKKPVLVLIPMHNGLTGEDGDVPTQASWMKEGQATKYHDNIMGVRITPAELTALSMVLGCPLDARNLNNDGSLQRGAFCISISRSVTETGEHKIILRQHKRGVSHMPARGSGFSPLFAKHLAAGSLPVSQDRKAVHSILVTSHTLKAVQSGSSLYLSDCKFKTPQSKFLSSLPTSRDLSFHIASASEESLLLNPLVDAVAALPFVGGLTPLASIPLIKTVRFIASGGLPSARLVQRLEGLVDKVNRQAPHLKIFGPLYEPQNYGFLYRERDRLGKLPTNTNTADSIADKTSRMQRYITLLERLMALVPNSKPQDVFVAVQEATRNALERSYIDAVAAHRANPSPRSSIIDSHGCPSSDARSKRTSQASREIASRSPRSSMVSGFSVASPRSSDTFPSVSLGKELEQVLKADLPLSVERIAFVARMVLVAWTLSVEGVAWKEGEEGFRVLGMEELPEKMMLR
jgi:hypothetical protein